MSVNNLKKELIANIENTNNEELLSLLKEDFVFYSKLKDSDITDDLSKEQINELRILSEENETADTHSLDEFKKATQKWRPE